MELPSLSTETLAECAKMRDKSGKIVQMPYKDYKAYKTSVMKKMACCPFTDKQLDSLFKLEYKQFTLKPIIKTN